MSHPTKPAVTQEVLQQWADSAPFIKACQMTITAVDAETGVVEMKMPLARNLTRDPEGRQFHGGPIASFIDTAGDFAVAVAAGGGVPTINFRVDYLRPSGGEYLIARATARRVGRTVGVADVDVFDDQGRLTAIGRGCYSSQPG
ncbi:PaaI family thioesterase [Verticiella sediminum]|uniref:PaaI family thioesterase n=1 Tax=Verticiella sediminum TaxID=1247510 RepID=A0A556AMW6_9BURK|nr:PaaI family thioesterase [Verticiella sediminum]TSH94221.1 PaaI family thioesterase [Verticiella sediminum]